MDFFGKLLVSIMCGIFCFYFLNFFSGDKGISEKKKLIKNIEKMELNLAELKKISEELTVLKKSLKNDDFYQLEARKIGYYKKNDVVIQINGYKKNREINSCGYLVQYKVKNLDSDKRILHIIISASFSFCFFIISLLFKKNEVVKYERYKSYRHQE